MADSSFCLNFSQGQLALDGNYIIFVQHKPESPISELVLCDAVVWHIVIYLK